METFAATHRYPTTVERLFDLFGRPAFWQEKFTDMGDQAIEILACDAGDDGALRIRTRREIPLKVPKLAQKVLGAANRVLTRDDWMPADDRGARAGTWAVEVVGRPLTLSGTMRLAPDGDGCCNQITGQIGVKVRLVGGAIAKLLLKDATRALDKEHAFTRAYLERP